MPEKVINKLKLNSKTAKFTVLLDEMNITQEPYHQGYYHVLSPAKNGERTYNHSFKYAYDAVMTAKGRNYKHHNKFINNNWRDWYLCLNTFDGSRRLEKYIRSFGGFWVDCDCHSEQNGDRQAVRTTTGSLWVNRFSLLATARLPYPTLIIFSGHGFYFIWLFKKQLPNNSPKIMRMWKSIEAKINKSFNKASNEIFGELLADPKATDPVHVLRIPDTYNNKLNPVQCQIEYINPNNRYNLIGNTYWNRRYPYKPNNAVKHNKHYRRKDKLILSTPRKHGFNTLAWDLLRDFKTYLQIHHYNIRGKRDSFFLYYSHWALSAWFGNTKDVIKSINRLNSKLVEPLPNDEMKHLANEINGKITCNSKRHYNLSVYKFSKSRMIKHLGITKADEAHMLILRPSSKAKRRQGVKERHAKQRNMKYRKIINLYRSGLNKSKIARIMKMSRRTVIRVIKASC